MSIAAVVTLLVAIPSPSVSRPIPFQALGKLRRMDSWGGRVAHAAAPSALRFDGVGSYVEVPDGAALRLARTLTLEAWLKPEAVTGHRHAVGKNNYELAVEPAGAGVRVLWEFATGSGWVSVASGELAPGRWYHVAGTYDGSAMRLFVDGAPVASAAVRGDIVQTAQPLRIGSADAAGDFFPGTLDEVRLSGVVRYPAAGFAPPQEPFVPDAATHGLWHLDEGSGPTAADASGNGNHGTLVNAPAWTADSP